MSLKVVPAELLLNENKDICFIGNFYQKISRFWIKQWLKRLVIISKGTIYTYPNSKSKLPTMMAHLNISCSIEIVKKFTLFVCVLKSDSSNPLSSIKFGAKSRSKLDELVRAVEESMKFNEQEIQLVGVSQRNSNSTSGYLSIPLPEISKSLTSSTMLKNEFCSDNNVIYINEKNTPKNDNRCSFTIYYDYSELCDPQLNLENIIFKGTSDEASKELFRSFHLGAFLIRLREDVKILTVQCQEHIIKYVLEVDPESNRVNIKGESVTFENIMDLLAHYHKFCLPRQNCKLTKPYKLCCFD